MYNRRLVLRYAIAALYTYMFILDVLRHQRAPWSKNNTYSACETMRAVSEQRCPQSPEDGSMFCPHARRSPNTEKAATALLGRGRQTIRWFRFGVQKRQITVQTIQKAGQRQQHKLSPSRTMSVLPSFNAAAIVFPFLLRHGTREGSARAVRAIHGLEGPRFS